MKPTTLHLILGDQLNPAHSWFAAPPAQTDVYCMMEIRSETDYARHHIQKVSAIFLGMRTFAEELVAKGFRVIYLKLNDANNQQNFAANLVQIASECGADTIKYQEPDEYRLAKDFEAFAKASHGLKVEACSSEHFICSREYMANFFGPKKPLMENFYRALRKEHGLLMVGQKPVQDQWNFDHDNRKPWKGDPQPAAYEGFSHDVADIIQDIEKAGVATMGTMDGKKSPWPKNSDEALQLLHFFVSNYLQHFGTYEDAMSVKNKYLFHSRLSFALNTKMLNPLAVCKAAEDAYLEGKADIQHVEGFIRQILGWREYMRGMYWRQMPSFASTNFFEHKAALPTWYWDGKTKMNCLSHSIGQSLTDAYAHHIQRLMVIGNFALLLGVDPDEVDAWYLGVYIDAYEWVEITNTRGMSQFADGGIVATKPYVASANYINKMSDYCKGCHYSKDERVGESACPFNTLYWDFLIRHEAKLAKNPRMGNSYLGLRKMSEGNRALVQEWAAVIKKSADSL